MKHKEIYKQALRLTAAAGVAAALAACGGGGNNGYEVGELPGTVTITGTAATVVAGQASQAIGGAAVYVSCKRGSGSGMTNADGTFSVTVTQPGVGPCVLQLFRTDNSSLRSIATGSGNFNITPVTELLTQYVSTQVGVSSGTVNAGNLLAENAGFNKLMTTPGVLEKSMGRVAEFAKTAPAPATPNLVTPANFLTGLLVARTATAAGNEQAVYLDALRARNTITTTGTLNSATVTPAVADAKLNLVTP